MPPPFVICGIALLAAAAAAAVAAESTDNLPPAWSSQGVTLLVENDRGAVYDVRYRAGETTPLHRHRYPFVGVDLNTTTIEVTQPDGTANSYAVVENGMWYLPKGLTHRETSVTRPGRHCVVIDIKDKTVPAAVNSTNLPVGQFATYQRKVVDNERVTVWDVAWAQGGEKMASFNDRDLFLAIADPGSIAIESPGHPAMVRNFKAGEAIFLPGGQARTISSAAGTPHAMLVEVK